MDSVAMLDRAKALKSRWRTGAPSFGIWQAIGSPMVSEIVGCSGYDWVFIDLEHTAIGFDTLQAMLMAFSSSPTVPIVRVPGSDPNDIKRVLDMGAPGILVPNVLTAQQASDVVRSVKYPPYGLRGWGPWRASGYFTDAAAYRKRADEDLIVMIQIESAAAIEKADTILATAGLDAVCSGPADLAFSLGKGGEGEDPQVQQCLERLFDAARRAGLPAASGVTVSAADINRMVSKGVTILPLTSDVGSITETGRTLMREATSSLECRTHTGRSQPREVTRGY